LNTQLTEAQDEAIFNAADHLININVLEGRGPKIAYIDDLGSYTYDQLKSLSQRTATALLSLGLREEERILLCMTDSFELPTTFLGAIYAGVIPVLANTLLTGSDYAFMLQDSKARIAIVSSVFHKTFLPLLQTIESLETVIISDGETGEWTEIILKSECALKPVNTHMDQPCFWLYSSGSTGRPKGTIHAQTSMRDTARLYAQPILNLTSNDIVFSAAKLFFAYGLGNALTFPILAGATTILIAERPTPEAVIRVLIEQKPTVFYGVPTLYASLLADASLPEVQDLSLRICTSAGEALPSDLSKKWYGKFHINILDGIGSTEMLHIFLSNRESDCKYGTTGKPLNGYNLKILDEDASRVEQGELGELYVQGPSMALMYWNNREKSRNTFLGQWTRTGDKYRIDSEGYYIYCGRSDDMLKVGGIYVSPTEVENTLTNHEAVLEAAVVGKADGSGLIKPKAFVVLQEGFPATPEMEDSLKVHVKNGLAAYKYPRWIDFVKDLPKTATGKIQRFKLRDEQ
jgi:benzoate-CoA ligase